MIMVENPPLEERIVRRDDGMRTRLCPRPKPVREEVLLERISWMLVLLRRPSRRIMLSHLHRSDIVFAAKGVCVQLFFGT